MTIANQHRNARTRIMTAGLVLGLGALAAGCGGGEDAKAASPQTSANDTGAYCAALKAGQSDIASFTAGTSDLARFTELVAMFEGIAAKAPDQIADDWNSLNGQLSALDKALTAAGLDLPAYIRAAGTGRAPTGITPEQWSALGAQVAGLQDPKIHGYGVAISADAKATCDLDLAPATP